MAKTVNLIKYTLSSAPKISIKLIARMTEQVRGCICNQQVSIETSQQQGTVGNKNTLGNFLPFNSKRLPCSLIQQIPHILQDCVERRSTPNNHTENQPSYLVFQELTRSTIPPDSFPLLSPEPPASTQLTLTANGADGLDFFALIPQSFSLWRFAIITLISLLTHGRKQSSGCSGNGEDRIG